MNKIFTKGQVSTVGAIVIAVLGIIGSIGASKVQSSAQADTRTNTIETDVKLLQQSDGIQNQTISEMKSNIEYIRRSIEEQNRRQGIIITETKK